MAKKNKEAAEEKQETPAGERMAYSLRETAGLLGVSYISIVRLVKRGLLRPSNALRNKIVSRDEIQRFLNETQSNHA